MRLQIRTDGGSRGNPGPGAAGVVIFDEQERIVFARGFYLGRITSNAAEYTGLLRALAAAQKLGGTDLEIFSDSELLVRQINGEYRVKSANLKDLYDQAKGLIRQFEKVSVRYVPRSENVEADALVNKALNKENDVAGGAAAAEDQKGSEPAVYRTVELSEKVQFHEAQPYRETLSRRGRLVTDLICLDKGQQCSVIGTWQQAAIIIMRGKGTVTVGAETQTVKTGSWLQLGRGRKIEFSADAHDQLVVIVTKQI